VISLRIVCFLRLRIGAVLIIMTIAPSRLWVTQGKHAAPTVVRIRRVKKETCDKACIRWAKVVINRARMGSVSARFKRVPLTKLGYRPLFGAQHPLSNAGTLR